MRSFEDLLSDREESIASAVIREIRAEVSTYAAVAPEAHRSAVERHIRDMLLGIRERRTPSASAVDHAKWIGRERARQGISRESVLDAYLIAFRVVWAELLSYAREIDQAAVLADRSNIVWEWNYRLTNAVTGSFDEEVRRLESELDATRRRLIAAACEADLDSTSDAAAACGLDLDDAALNIATACLRPPSDVLPLAADLNAVPGVVAAPHPRLNDVCIAIVQGERRAKVRNLLDAHAVLVAGVGHPRSGPTGLIGTVADCLESLALARLRRETVTFTDAWLDVMMATNRSRLTDVLASGTSVAEQNPVIAETVAVYLGEAEMSLKQAGVVLNVHPNTVKYRIARWESLTGWSLSNRGGIAASGFAAGRGSDPALPQVRSPQQ